MPFNGTILDFYQQFSSLKFDEVNLIECKDPFWSKLVNDRLRTEISNLSSKWGEDLSEEWVSETWFDLSLFANTDCFFIYNTGKASKKVLELMTLIEAPSEKVFLHVMKEPKGFSKSLKAKSTSIKIKEFNFWELDKLLDFFSLLLDQKLSRAIRQYYANWTIEQKREIYDQLSYLSLIYEDLSSVELPQIQEVLDAGELNPFTLTDHISQRRIKVFYNDLLKNLEHDHWASSHKAVTFLRSFLLKSVDPDYRNKKARLNAFDKKVIATQQNFAPREISALLKDLSGWEIKIKRKDRALIQELQSRVIAQA